MQSREKPTPKVLVLSGEIPQTRNAGGIVMWRLFKGYGKQAQLADQETKRLKVEKVKEPGWHGALGKGLVKGEGDFDKGDFDISKNEGEAKLFVIGPKAHAEAELLDCPYRELRMTLARLEKTRFSLHKRSLAALGIIPLPSHERVIRLLGDFQPDVVVCVMANTPWILTAERTARMLGIPLVLIVHDINEQFEKVFPWANQALFRKNRDVYRAAARRLCVSPEMAEFLEKRYGVPGEVMYPNRSEELQPRALDDSLVLRASIQGHEALGARREDNKRPEARGARLEEGEGDFDILKNSPPATSNSLHTSALLTLGYAGSLAYGYGEALVALIPVLREVGARILISTPRPPEKLKVLLEATDVVEWMPHRADINEMWRTMQDRADVMILPYMNPAGSNELLYRTHFPSKLTEYLALGMPVAVSGPEYATGLRYAQGRRQEAGDREQEARDFDSDHFDILKRAPNGAAPCATREELVTCLLRLKQHGELRMNLAKRAVAAGHRDFDPAMIRERFRGVLKEAIV